MSDPEISEKFEIATLGYQGMNTRRFPWPQYHHLRTDIDPSWIDAVTDWIEGGETIIMPVMPPSWLFVYLRPNLLEQVSKQAATKLRELNKRIHWWPYIAVEGTTAQGTLGLPATETLKMCERVLWYSKWAQETGERSGIKGDWVHHGLDFAKFSAPGTTYERKDELPVVGCVMTNQWRKRWNLVFEAMAELKDKAHLYIITDSLVGYWDLNNLADQYSLPVEARLSGPLFTDEMMIEFYRSCDVGVLASYGEGFGFPVLEFMAQGKPVVTGTWGAQSELVENIGLLVPPVGHETDGVHCHVKPFYNPKVWQCAITSALGVNSKEASDRIKVHAGNWDWSYQLPKFKQWFLEGLK